MSNTSEFPRSQLDYNLLIYQEMIPAKLSVALWINVGSICHPFIPDYRLKLFQLHPSLAVSFVEINWCPRRKQHLRCLLFRSPTDITPRPEPAWVCRSVKNWGIDFLVNNIFGHHTITWNIYFHFWKYKCRGWLIWFLEKGIRVSSPLRHPSRSWSNIVMACMILNTRVTRRILIFQKIWSIS